MMKYCRILALGCPVALLMQLGGATHAADRTLVADGEATSAIVLGERDVDVAQRAADELIYHVERASGAELPIVEADAISEVPEEHTIVVIGTGDMAASLGVSRSDLRREEFVIKTQGRHVIFAGYNLKPTNWAVDYFLDR